MLTPGEIDRLVRKIVARIQPEKIFIFGSYAKGTATIKSDLDILVIKETDLPMAIRADDLKPMLSGALIPIDLLVYTPEEVESYASEPFSFVNSVVQSGKIVFEKQSTRKLPLSGKAPKELSGIPKEFSGKPVS